MHRRGGVEGEGRMRSTSSGRAQAGEQSRVPEPGRAVRVLRVPADPGRPCEVVSVQASSTAFSDAIGGGLLDDGIEGQIGDLGYCVYQDEERLDKRLPDNARAHRLLVHLGLTGARDRIRWSGDALIAGTGSHGEDVDVPDPVIALAREAALLATGDPPD